MVTMDFLSDRLFPSMVSSLLTALIIMLWKNGWRFTQGKREKEAKRRNLEEAAWVSNERGARIHITNHYLFSILRFLFLGNLIWLFPGMLNNILVSFGGDGLIFGVTGLVFHILALAFLYLGIGQILRYQKVRSLSEEEF